MNVDNIVSILGNVHEGQIWRKSIALLSLELRL